MPSLRHGSAMLSSPRRPSSTIRILSSAEKCRRVARRIGPRPDSTLFVMSGADKRTYREVLTSCGARISGFLSKPFGAGELACALSSPSTTFSPHTCIWARAFREVLSPSKFEEIVLAGRFEPFYQPIFHSDGRTLKGFEALARVEGGQRIALPRNTWISWWPTKICLQRSRTWLSSARSSSWHVFPTTMNCRS